METVETPRVVQSATTFSAGTAPRLLRLAPGAVRPLQRVVEADAVVLLDDIPDRFRGHRVGDRLPLQQALRASEQRLRRAVGRG